MSKHPEDTGEEPDEMEAVAESHADTVVDSLDRSRKFILIGILAVAVLICAVLVFREMGKQKHLEAGSAFSSAVAKREIPALDEVVVKYPGSIAAGNALLVKADIQIDQGKDQDALATLQTFLNDYPDHPRHAQAHFAAGTIYQISGDADKAKAEYDKVLAEQPDGELSPITYLRMGDLALAAGDKDKADQYYQDSISKFPGSPYFGMAEEKIEMLKVGNPPVVDKPEPKPEPKKADETKESVTEQKPAEADKPNAPKEKSDSPKAKSDSKGKKEGNAAKGKKADKPSQPAEKPKAKEEPKADKASTPKEKGGDEARK